MRIICDSCENAPAVVFCAADEAALCGSCDEKVHMCNKLASRHVRVGLANPSEFQRCDICENAPAFFYCDVDGSSLCLQCDMTVHVGGKRTHGRYLLMRQRVVFQGNQSDPTDDPPLQLKNKINSDIKQAPKQMTRENLQNHRGSPTPAMDTNGDIFDSKDTKIIDLNVRPPRIQGQGSNTQARIAGLVNGGNHDRGVVPVGHFERDADK